MPISSSRQRLMRQTAKPKSLTNVTVQRTNEKPTTKHCKKVSKDKIALPKIDQLQINEVINQGQPQFQYSTSPFSRSNTPSSTKEKGSPSRRKKAENDQLRDIAFKKIRIFNKVPELEPLTLVLRTLDDSITHLDILCGLKKVRQMSLDDVKSIQFVDMNVVVASAGVPNRWLIRMKGYKAFQLLLEEGFTVNGERMFFRRYDDVNAEDYSAYIKRKALLVSDEHSEIQKLLENNRS